MARNDPLRNFRFRLEIDQITQALFQRGGDRRDRPPIRSTIARAPIRPTSASCPGLTKYGNITLKWGVTDSVELYEWHKDVVAGQIKDKRKTVKIVVIDEAGADKASFLVSEAWPTKYDPSDLNGKGNEVFIELLELVNEGIERTA